MPFRMTPKDKTVLATMYKALVAACQLGAQAIAWGLLHGTALHVTSLVIAAIGLIGVYKVPNAPKEVVAGTADLEARLHDLENVVPDLPDLVDAIGKVVEGGITKAFTTAPPPQVTVVAPAAPEQTEGAPIDLNRVTDPPMPPVDPAVVARPARHRRPSPRPINPEETT